MKRRKRSIISAVLVIVLCMGMVLNVNATTVDEAQKKADELENQKKSAEKEKDSLSSQLNSIVSDMKVTKEKLGKKQEEIQIAEDELVQAKVDENDQYESMKKRIKFMYENGNSQLLEILISSDSIGDLLNKAEYVSQISAYDRDMLIEFQDVVKDVGRRKRLCRESMMNFPVCRMNWLRSRMKYRHYWTINRYSLPIWRSRLGIMQQPCRS